MKQNRRQWLGLSSGVFLAPLCADTTVGWEAFRRAGSLKITDLKVTPIALPDPPILAASGCHGPYFLRNIVQLETDAGIVGIGETRGGEVTRRALEEARELILGQNAFAYRSFATQLIARSVAAYAAIEVACLDACGRATGRRLCELLGGPVRDEVPFAAYLFFRFAADHPKLLADPRIADDRGRGDRALDDWGEVRTPETMAAMAARFHHVWGFRVFKLKAGVLAPDRELEAIEAINAQFGGKYPLRIDPNGRWKHETAVRIGRLMQDLKLEYYEDPVQGQEAMAAVRRETGLAMSTNMCVTRFEHVPDALRLRPVDIVLADHHYWGGITGCQALGQVCQMAGWKVSQHSNNHAGISMAAMIHLAAVVPQLTLASDTHYPWLPEGSDIIGPKLSICDGMMPVPTRPGVGVELDLDQLARANETYRKCGMRERDDAATMRLIEPDWKSDLL